MILDLDAILATFTATLNNYYPLIFTYGVRILGILVVLGMGLVAVRTVASGNFTAGLYELLWGLVKLGLVFAVMEHIQDWGNALIDTGKELGAIVSGAIGTPLSPNAVYNSVATQAKLILYTRSLGSWLVNPLGDMLSEVLASIVVPLVAFGAAMVFFFTLLEAAYLIATAPVIIALSATEMTFPILLRWAYRLAGFMLKIFTLALVLTVGGTMVRDWTQYLINLGIAFNYHPLAYTFLTVAEALLFLYMVWKLPAVAQHLIGGDVSALTWGEMFLGSASGTAIGAMTAPTGAAVRAIAKESGQSAHELALKVRDMIIR
jgi:type IV secretory pathway TrbL component